MAGTSAGDGELTAARLQAIPARGQAQVCIGMERVAAYTALAQAVAYTEPEWVRGR
jgi:hypothetical protein